jgi:phage terminase small subunit
MAKALTEKEQRFLEALFDGANGDVVAAKRIAGYSENSSTAAIVNALKDEIAEATRTFMSRIAPKAAYALNSGMDDPTQLGIRDKIAAAKDVLDRTGFAKTEKVEVGGSNPLFILPAKNETED